MGLPSDQQLKEFAEFVKSHRDWTNQDYAEHFDRALSTIENWKHGCYQQGLLQKGDQRPVTRYEGDDLSPQEIISETRNKYSPDSDPTNNDVKSLDKVKLAFGDLHLCDEDVMWRSIKSALRNTISHLNQKDYSYLEVINCGDTVSGTSIYRGQQVRNLTNKPHWQTTAGAIFQQDMFDQIIEQTSISDYEVHIVKGNHDQAGSSRGTNLAFYMTRDMQALGIPATYEGEHYVSDNIYAVHGFGGSDYRPQSPKFERTLQKRLHNLNHQEDRKINRILHGHTHWADDDFKYTISVAFDCLGGFQRNKRADLGKLQRPAGFIVYEYKQEIWESEPSWQPKLIQPDDDIFWEEAEQTDLEFQNVSRIGDLLKKSYKVEKEA